jgi:hypothetical protein
VGILEDTGNAATQKLFINGALVASSSGARMGTQYSLHPRVGGSQHLNGPFYKGKIDEVRIYERALSALEITDLYTQQ